MTASLTAPYYIMHFHPLSPLQGKLLGPSCAHEIVRYGTAGKLARMTCRPGSSLAAQAVSSPYGDRVQGAT
jgi:hypothetical protein